MDASRPGPVTAVWAWDNPVDPGVDPRGRAYAPAAPDRLAAFARAGGLREVHLHVPEGSGDGPVDAWVREAVGALHDAGVQVTAVVPVRAATVRWAATATALAPFDRLQVAVVPWHEVPAGTSASAAGRALVEAVAAVRGAGTGLPVDACVPWWCASRPAHDGGTLLDAVLGAVDRVALAAPAPRAAGPGGVLELAAPAVEALVAAGRPFLVGVQTEVPDVAGGADRTFWEEGPVAMVRECAAVTEAMAHVPGFGGVAVQGHRAWRRLLGV